MNHLLGSAELDGPTRLRTRPRRAVAAVAILATALVLSACSAPARPAASAPQPSPTSVCPSAEQVAAVTALPFASTGRSATACTYATEGSEAVDRIALRPTAAGRTTTLSTIRTRLDRPGTRLADARGFSFDAFTARTGQRCSVWFAGPDGGVASVAAEPADGGASGCRLASATAALLPRPPARTVPGAVVSVVAPEELLGSSSRTAALVARVGAEAKARTDRVLDAGTGFVAGGGGMRSAARAVRPESRAVVFVSGTADAGRDRLRILRAATDALSSAARTAPGTRLVLVGPVLGGTASASEVLALRDALALAARVDGARFVDPIAEGWTADTVDDELPAAVATTID